MGKLFPPKWQSAHQVLAPMVNGHDQAILLGTLHIALRAKAKCETNVSAFVVVNRSSNGEIMW